MNTDNYDFEKSNVPQSIGSYSPYISKDANNYINDQNSGVYSSSTSTIQFDLSSLYNSSRYVNSNDMFLALPISLAIATSVGATLGAPPTAAWALACLKSGYHHLIHSAELVIDGQTVSQTQPFLGTFTHVKLLSELSVNDLRTMGTSIGFSDCLDSVGSAIWNGVAVNANGNGFCNNTAFGSTTQTSLLTGQAGNQNTGICNEAINKRVLRTTDTSKAGLNKIVGNIVTPLALATDFKPTYQVANTNYGVLQDVAIIRLKDLFEAMSNIGLVRRFNGVLRLTVNTGNLFVNCVGNATNPQYDFDIVDSTFQNVCPITINHLNALAADGGIPATHTQVSVGLFIGRTMPTSLNTVNLGNAVPPVAHPMQSARLYYSSIQLEPDKALTYSRATQNKQVVFRNYYYNQINNIGAGGNYSQLIQSGIVNPHALIVIPYISKDQEGMGFYQWQSPFDTAPATGAPLILDTLSVSLGGVNVLPTNYNYGFEDFLLQYANSEALTSSDWGISTGLVDRNWWDNNRIYYINLSRGTAADMSTPRAVTLSFRNASAVKIDLKVFTVYLDSFNINTDTGAVSR